MYKLSKCALCGKTGDIQLSHIIPKFIGRNLKKTSIGEIRNTENPKIPIQDIEKHYLLCHDCEELFSASESWFSKNIFYPYLRDGENSFDYNENLHFFLTSLSWRSLYLDIMDYIQFGGIERDALECLIDSELIMREYLLGKKSDIGLIENHIFFFDRLENITGEDADEMKQMRPHVTMHRGIASYSHCCEDKTYYTFTNMMGIIAVALYSKGNHEKWTNTKVICGSGKIKAKDQHMVSVVGNEFKYLMKNVDKQKDRMSKNQQEKINEKFKELDENIKDYNIYNDMIDDINLQK